MTVTLELLRSRKKAYEGQQQMHYEIIERQQKELEAVSALLLQIAMLEMAEADPTIEGFRFDANYEYDDEGAYYWSASIRAEGEKHEMDEIDQWEECEVLEQIADERSTKLAFGSQSSFDGRITVAQLRADLLKGETA